MTMAESEVKPLNNGTKEHGQDPGNNTKMLEIKIRKSDPNVLVKDSAYCWVICFGKYPVIAVDTMLRRRRRRKEEERKRQIKKKRKKNRKKKMKKSNNITINSNNNKKYQRKFYSRPLSRHTRGEKIPLLSTYCYYSSFVTANQY